MENLTFDEMWENWKNNGPKKVQRTLQAVEDISNIVLTGLIVCERSESCSDKISGWIVHLLPVLSRKDIESFPADLAKCIEFAVQEGSDLIIFDQCERPINCLPTYDDSDTIRVKRDTLEDILSVFLQKYEETQNCYQAHDDFATWLSCEIAYYDELLKNL